MVTADARFLKIICPFISIFIFLNLFISIFIFLNVLCCDVFSLHGSLTIFFIISDEGGLLLASGSKDATVRLWKLSKLPDLSEPQEEQDTELKLKSITFEIPSLCEDISMCALLDTVLSGHEGLVSEVCWARPALHG